MKLQRNPAVQCMCVLGGGAVASTCNPLQINSRPKLPTNNAAPNVVSLPSDSLVYLRYERIFGNQIPDNVRIATKIGSDPIATHSLPIYKDHSLVIHREGVAFDGSDCFSGILPLHVQPGAVLCIGRAHLTCDLSAGWRDKDRFRAARPIGIDGESARTNLQGSAFVRNIRRYLLPIDGDQGIDACRISVVEG